MATSPVSSLTIASTGSGKTVVVDGLDIYGLPGGSALDYVVLAAGTVTVRIQDSLIHGSQGNALNRLGGDVTIVRTEITGVGAPAIYFQSGGGGFTLDRSYVHGNGGMLTIDAATALIENNLIVDNNGTGGDSAMQMNVTSTLKFRANTVANNHVPAGGLSFTCQGVVNTISDSIIVGNTATAGTQLQGCTLSHVVTGADGASAATQLLPAFVSATDYHLKPTDAANTACCIDKLGAGPAVDYDGTARPSGAAFDIGAFEAH